MQASNISFVYFQSANSKVLEDDDLTLAQFGILTDKSIIEIYKSPDLKAQIKGSAKA